MKIFSCVVVACCCLGYEAPAQTQVTKWLVEKSSTLRVEGKSNVNNFTCNINSYKEKDIIVCIDDPAKEVKLYGELQLDVLGFNCHNELITKDFRKTLQAKEHPTMLITFISLECMPMLQNQPELIKGWIEVKLAGVIKRFELTYKFSQTGTGIICLDSGRSFKFSDFELKPPTKFGGLVKIKDAFVVKFQLQLKVV